MLARSVIGLSGDEIRKTAGLGEREIDVLFGGAPCQGFSLIGKRALDDPRNSLVREFVRLVDELRPSYFLFENVKGLTVGQHRGFLDELINAFGDVGYDVLLPWQVLNACHFGVPQDRERLILLGAKVGMRLPSYPQPSTLAAGSEQTGLLPLGPTCSDALDDLPDAEEFETLKDLDEVRVTRWGKASDYAAYLRCVNRQSWYFGYRRSWDRMLLTASNRTEHTEISRRRFAETAPGEVEPISRFYRLPRKGISNTLRAGTDSARGAFTSPRPIHYKYARCVTVREMARLHGFPDWFRFHVTKWHGARQVGNSVPPPLARAIAHQITDALDLRPTAPSEGPLPLGDTGLLQLGMTEAAEYFDVAVPIGRRDHKSGAKKRKQAEIEAIRLSNEA